MRCSTALPLSAALLFVAPISSANATDSDDFPLVPDVVTQFDAAALQTPESIATDYWGNLYISQALTGEITRVDEYGTAETLAVLPIGAPLQECFGFFGGLGGLTWTPWGVYVNVNACDEEVRGVWWVSPYSGYSVKVASLPPETFANGIAHRFGQLYISDSFNTRIWRASAFGGDAEIWVEDPLLAPDPEGLTMIAGNGVQFYGGELYVSNSSTKEIIAFPVHPGETAGPSRVHASLENGCDDFAFDLFGTLYCGTNPVNSIVAVYPDGETEIVVDEDELDGPTSAAFGRLHDRYTMYIANASFPIYPSSQGNPSVVSIELPVPGWPFR